jgi:hypothetical protein
MEVLKETSALAVSFQLSYETELALQYGMDLRTAM